MLNSEMRPANLERRELLLAVARRVFAERGFTATTMDDVARAAGFTKPILYQYFDSKTDLYREIVSQTAATLLNQLELAVHTTESPRARIEVAFRVYFEMVVSEPDAFRILFIHAHEGETAAELRNLELGLVSFIEPYITVEISAEHRRQLAAGVVGIAEGTAVAWLVQRRNDESRFSPPDEAARLAARAATLAWGGLRAVTQD
ncbi:MAG: TetR/AcrR family transcriptional regulator [Acidimicrobiales bacterium]